MAGDVEALRKRQLLARLLLSHKFHYVFVIDLNHDRNFDHDLGLDLSLEVYLDFGYGLDITLPLAFEFDSGTIKLVALVLVVLFVEFPYSKA